MKNLLQGYKSLPLSPALYCSFFVLRLQHHGRRISLHFLHFLPIDHACHFSEEKRMILLLRAHHRPVAAVLREILLRMRSPPRTHLSALQSSIANHAHLHAPRILPRLPVQLPLISLSHSLPLRTTLPR